jgi:hypothetical protein
MISDDLYNVWKRQRRHVDVDSRFADRVMEQIGEHKRPQHHRAAVVVERSPRRFARHIPVAAAVFVVGLGVGLIRASSMIIFLLLSTSRGY